MYPNRLNLLSAVTLSAVTWLSISLTATGFAQDVDVDSRRSDVQIDRQGVDVDVSRDRQADRSPRRTWDRRRDEGEADSVNQQIARWVLIDQQSLVNLSRFGLQRTKTPEVRQLAEEIVRDHSRLAEKLAAAIGEPSRPSGARSAEEREREQDRRMDAAEDQADYRDEEDREARRERVRDVRRERDDERRPLENIADRIEEGVERVADRTERAVEDTRRAVRRELNDDDRPRRNSISWLTIHGSIAREVTEAAKQDLEQRQGYEFDASFVGMLSAVHLQQEATLEELARRASGELSSTLSDARETIRNHRQTANRVMENIQR